jgi:DNA-binding transcriptional MerR regulator
MSQPEKIPRKLYYRIQEVSKLAGVEPYVLRYWESVFDDLRPEKDERGQRRYRQQDLALIFHIKKLLYEKKFTIAGAQQALQRQRKAPRPLRSLKQVRQRLGGLRKQLKEMLRELSS